MCGAISWCKKASSASLAKFPALFGYSATCLPRTSHTVGQCGSCCPHQSSPRTRRCFGDSPRCLAGELCRQCPGRGHSRNPLFYRPRQRHKASLLSMRDGARRAGGLQVHGEQSNERSTHWCRVALCKCAAKHIIILIVVVVFDVVVVIFLLLGVCKNASESKSMSRCSGQNLVLLSVYFYTLSDSPSMQRLSLSLSLPPPPPPPPPPPSLLPLARSPSLPLARSPSLPLWRRKDKGEEAGY
jgi:hypothetical protein